MSGLASTCATCSHGRYAHLAGDGPCMVVVSGSHVPAVPCPCAVYRAGERPLWQITVRVPLDLPADDRDRLFVAVSDAVALWEPQRRDGWDSCVYACPASEEGGR